MSGFVVITKGILNIDSYFFTCISSRTSIDDILFPFTTKYIDIIIISFINVKFQAERYGDYLREERREWRSRLHAVEDFYYMAGIIGNQREGLVLDPHLESLKTYSVDVVIGFQSYFDPT